MSEGLGLGLVLTSSLCAMAWVLGGSPALLPRCL